MKHGSLFRISVFCFSGDCKHSVHLLAQIDYIDEENHNLMLLDQNMLLDHVKHECSEDAKEIILCSAFLKKMFWRS